MSKDVPKLFIYLTIFNCSRICRIRRGVSSLIFPIPSFILLSLEKFLTLMDSTQWVSTKQDPIGWDMSHIIDEVSYNTCPIVCIHIIENYLLLLITLFIVIALDFHPLRIIILLATP